MRELINIIITTYDRLEICRKTIQGLKANLIYENLAWILADDGSPEGYVEALLDEIGTDYRVQVTNAARRGVGASKNLALRKAFEESPLYLMIEDDWLLRDKLDLSPFADLLVTNQSVGIVRFGYLPTNLTADLVGTEHGYGPISYWRIRQGSGVYCYSGQVGLLHKRFIDKVGWHKEGVTPGAEELDMCIRFNGTENAPEILWPATIASHYQCSPFYNIGMDNSLNSVVPEA